MNDLGELINACEYELNSDLAELEFVLDFEFR